MFYISYFNFPFLLIVLFIFCTKICTVNYETNSLLHFACNILYVWHTLFYPYFLNMNTTEKCPKLFWRILNYSICLVARYCLKFCYYNFFIYPLANLTKCLLARLVVSNNAYKVKVHGKKLLIKNTTYIDIVGEERTPPI